MSTLALNQHVAFALLGLSVDDGQPHGRLRLISSTMSICSPTGPRRKVGGPLGLLREIEHFSPQHLSAPE